MKLTQALSTLGISLAALPAAAQPLPFQLARDDAPKAVRQAERNLLTALADNPRALEGLRRRAGTQSMQEALYTMSGSLYANEAVMASMNHGGMFNSLEPGLTATRTKIYTEGGWRQDNPHPAGFDMLRTGGYGLLGVATPLSSAWTVTAAGYYIRGDVDDTYGHATHDHADTHGWGFMLGTRYTAPAKTYIDAIVGYGHSAFEVTRKVAGGRSIYSTGATPRLNLFQGRLMAGQPFDIARGLSITPELGVAYTRGRLDSFVEQNANGWGLRANARTDSTTTLLARLNAQYAFSIYGVPMRISSRVGWQHDLNERDFRSTGGFEGYPMHDAKSGQWEAVRSRMELGLGLGADITDDLAAELRYDARLADDYRAGQIMIRLAYSF